MRPVAGAVLAIALAGGLAGASGAEPEAAERLNALSLSAYLDEDDTWSTEVMADVPVGQRLRIFGSVGYSALNLGSAPLSGANRDLEFAYGTAGLGYEKGRFSSDLSFGVWGDDEVVATRDLRASAGYDTARGGIRLTGVYRDLDFTVRRFVPDVGVVTEARSTEATGVGLELRVSPTGTWRIYAGGETSDYDDQLEQLLGRIPLQLLAQRQLTLSSTFPDWAWRAGTDVFLGMHRVNLEYAADKSIFGGLESTATSVAWQFPLGASGSWALDLRIGRADADLSAATAYGLASLSLVY